MQQPCLTPITSEGVANGKILQHYANVKSSSYTGKVVAKQPIGELIGVISGGGCTGNKNDQQRKMADLSCRYHIVYAVNIEASKK